MEEGCESVRGAYFCHCFESRKPTANAVAHNVKGKSGNPYAPFLGVLFGVPGILKLLSAKRGLACAPYPIPGMY